MSSSATLYTPPSLEYVINHVFFPLCHPQHDDYSPKNVHTLVSAVQAAAHAYNQHVDDFHEHHWSHITKMLKNLTKTEHARPWSEAGQREYEHESLEQYQDHITSQIHGMKTGDILAFPTRYDPVVVMFRRYSQCTLYELFTVTVQPPRSKIVGPAQAIEIPNEVFDDQRRRSQLVESLSLDITPTDTFRDIGHSVVPPCITKKPPYTLPFRHHFHGSQRKWSRLALWFLLRVAIQSSLDRSPCGHTTYKTFVLFFMCNFADHILSSYLPSLLLHSMSTKILRRFKKLPCSSAPTWLCDAVSKTCTNLSRILDERWRKQLTLNSSPSWNPAQFNLTEDIQPSFVDVRKYISSSLVNCSSNPPLPLFLPYCHLRGTLADFLSRSEMLPLDSHGFLPHLQVTLYDVEQAVRDSIDDWLASVANADEASGQIEYLAFRYQALVDTYVRDKDADDPDHNSTACLTLIELWIALDKLAIEQAPILANYSPEVPADLLCRLILRDASSIHRVSRAYLYLLARHNQALPGWSVLTDQLTENSFSCRYYDSSPELQRLKSSLQDSLPYASLQAKAVVFELACPVLLNRWQYITCLISHGNKTRCQHASKRWYSSPYASGWLQLDRAGSAPTYNFKLPSGGGYAESGLQRYLDDVQHTSNEILAALTHRHLDLSSQEYLAFAHLRSGGSLQWLNILWELRSRSLNFRQRDVYLLLAQTAAHVGPFDHLGVSLWRREIEDTSFCQALLYELEVLFVDIGVGSLDEPTMAIISLLAGALASRSSVDVSKQAFQLLRKVRRKTLDWVYELLYNARSSPANKERLGLLQNMAAICRSTFDLGSAMNHALLQSPEDVEAVLSCAMIIRATGVPPSSGDQTYSQMLLHRDRRLSLVLETRLRDAVQADVSDTGIDRAVQTLWPGYRPSSRRWESLHPPNSRWLVCETAPSGDTRPQIVHINLLDGSLLVDGKPTDCTLPSCITNNSVYRELFAGLDIMFVASDLPGMDFVTVSEVHNHHVHFAVRRDDRIGERVIIRAKTMDADDILELIPREIFRLDLPNSLTEGHVHWLNIRTSIIEIRPIDEPWKQSLDNWTIHLSSKQPRVTKRGEFLVGKKSPAWEMVSSRFECLDHSENLMITATEVVTGQSQSPSLRLSVALPRYGLSFFLNEIGNIESQDFKDMIYDEDQCVGTLFGLVNKLVLRPKVQIEEDLIPKLIIIPFGDARDHHSNHVHNIAVAQEYGPVRFYTYQVDNELGCLKGTTSLESRLYLAHLHTLTGSCRPDPLTGRTGLEEAISLIWLAGTRQGYAPRWWATSKSYQIQFAMKKLCGASVSTSEQDSPSEEDLLRQADSELDALREDSMPEDSENSSQEGSEDSLQEGSENSSQEGSEDSLQGVEWLKKLENVIQGKDMAQEHVLREVDAVLREVELFPSEIAPNIIQLSGPLASLAQLFLKRSVPDLPERGRLSDRHRSPGFKGFSQAGSPNLDPLRQLFSSLRTTEDAPPFQSQYLSRLNNSAHHFRTTTNTIRSTPEWWTNATTDRLRGHYVQCKTRYSEGLKAVQKALGPITEFEQILDKCGQWPRITPFILFRCLASTFPVKLPGDWKKCLISLALLALDVQRARRLLQFALAGLEDESNKELENEGLDGWDHGATCHLDWLLIQLQGNFTIRRVQADVAKEMMSPRLGRNTVIQVNMGEGKTSVIIPICAVALADGDQLVRVVVPKSLIHHTLQILTERLCGLIDKPVYQVTFTRDDLSDSSARDYKVKQLQTLLRKCKDECGIILTQPEHILSLKLACVEMQLVGNGNGIRVDTSTRSTQDASVPTSSMMFARLAGSSHETSEVPLTHARDIIDESDEVLRPQFQLIYAAGRQYPFEGSPDRWLISQQVLGLANGGGQFLLSLIVQDVLDGHLPNLSFHSELGLRGAIREFILRKDICPDTAKVVESYARQTTGWSSLLLLRGLLAHNILLFALTQRRWRVDYGLDPSSPPRTMLAIPYHAKDVPAETAEFGHPDVTVLLTCLSYYYGGLSERQLRVAFELLLQKDNPASEYAVWLEGCNTASVPLPSTLQKLEGVNIRSLQQWTKYLVPMFTRNKRAIDLYLSKVVFPKHAKDFPRRISGSYWDIAERKDHPITGFSGTDDGQYLLPTSIIQDSAEHLRYAGTNARVLSYLLRQENSAYAVTSDGNGERWTTLKLLETITAQDPEIRVLLDVGAQILDQSNFTLARTWLQCTTAARITGAIYFSVDDNLMVLARNGITQPLSSSSFVRRLDRCVIYLDDAHTRGTDIKFPCGFRAAVTLGHKVTKDRLVQGCMRMRKLGHGHSVMFFAPQEVDQKIRCLVAKESRKIPITTADILHWAIRETWNDIQQQAPYWAHHGMDHQSRYEAWSRFCQSAATPRELADSWVQPELQSLADMYLPCNSADPTLFTKLPRQIRERCENLGVLSLRDVRLDEEQEKEVSREIQRERQVQEHYPRAFPAEHFLHPHVLMFVRTGVAPLPSPSMGFRPVFPTTVTATSNELHTWSPCILATIDFLQTIQASESVRGRLNHYLRPVQWVISGKMHGRDVLLLVSPFEANLLLPEIRVGKHVHLHLYVPRTTKRMRPADDLMLYSIPPLPSDWTPPWNLIDQLNIFAGQLYVSDYASYMRVCRFLGVHTDDLPQNGGTVVARNWLSDPNPASGDAEIRNRLEGTPLPFATQMLVARRGMQFGGTHMGKILDGLPLTEADFQTPSSWAKPLTFGGLGTEHKQCGVPAKSIVSADKDEEEESRTARKRALESERAIWQSKRKRPNV